MGYRDNRDIRDNRYEGDLIIECVDGVSKEEALKKIKKIIVADRDYSQRKIDEHQVTVDRCNLRLKEL